MPVPPVPALARCSGPGGPGPEVRLPRPRPGFGAPFPGGPRKEAGRALPFLLWARVCLAKKRRHGLVFQLPSFLNFFLAAAPSFVFVTRFSKAGGRFFLWATDVLWVRGRRSWHSPTPSCSTWRSGRRFLELGSHTRLRKTQNERSEAVKLKTPTTVPRCSFFSFDFTKHAGRPKRRNGCGGGREDRRPQSHGAQRRGGRVDSLPAGPGSRSSSRVNARATPRAPPPHCERQESGANQPPSEAAR